VGQAIEDLPRIASLGWNSATNVLGAKAALAAVVDNATVS